MVTGYKTGQRIEEDPSTSNPVQGLGNQWITWELKPKVDLHKAE